MDVRLTRIDAAKTLYGCWGASSDRGQARDIPALAGRFYAAIGKREGDVLPFYVLSKDYDEKTHAFSLFIGGEEAHVGLEPLTLPEGTYGCITVRPKLGVLWGAAVGAAKRYFYARWLPASPYEALNMEFELHDARSVGKKPEITIWFAVRERA